MGRQTLRGIDDVRQVASGWLLALRAGASTAGLLPCWVCGAVGGLEGSGKAPPLEGQRGSPR